MAVSAFHKDISSRYIPRVDMLHCDFLIGSCIWFGKDSYASRIL